MKIYNLFILLVLILFPTLIYAGVSDPLADLKTKYDLDSGDIVYKLSIDINGDGKSDILFCYKGDYDDALKIHEPPPWDIYIADSTGGTYTASTGTDFNDGNGVGPGYATIDPSAMFVGQITQLGKVGIVTIQTDYPKKLPASSTIYAYTVESGYIKQTMLTKFAPGQINIIFNQYLSDAHRTQITPQQVTVP